MTRNNLSELQQESERLRNEPTEFTTHWYDVIPGYSYLVDSGIPSKLLYRLFHHSQKGRLYWLRSHAPINTLTRANSRYAVHLASCALAQGFDQRQTESSQLRQTTALLEAWWAFHRITPSQPEMELITILGDALMKTKEIRANFNPAEASRQYRMKRAAREGREFKGFKVGETSSKIAFWLQEHGPATAQQISETLGLTVTSVRMQLSRLVKQAHNSRFVTNDPNSPDTAPIFKIGYGLYQFGPPEVSPLNQDMQEDTDTLDELFGED